MKDKQTTQPSVPEAHKEIRAESFVLVDSNGQNRAELKYLRDESVLVMRDGQGLMRLTLRAGARETTLNIFGDTVYKKKAPEAVDLLSIGWEMDDQTPFVKIHYRDDESDETFIRDLAFRNSDDEDDDEDDAPPAASDKQADNAELLAEEFRERCYELAEAIICVTESDRCPKYARTVLLNAVAEISNHQDETEQEEEEFIKRAYLKLAT